MKEFKSWWEKSKKKKQLSILNNIPSEVNGCFKNRRAKIRAN